MEAQWNINSLMTELCFAILAVKNDRTWIFGTQCNIECLSQSHSLFSDGTFIITPGHLFQKLNTIHVVHFGAVLFFFSLLFFKAVETWR